VRDRGSLFIVSAPSGTGKTTLVEALVSKVKDLEVSRSYTSRPPRPTERDGVEYNFIARCRFEKMRAAGEFLEWADVFGHLYGTSAVDARHRLNQGRDLLLVIDVQGAHKVRRLAAGAVGIFVLPPSRDELQRRLRRRSGQDLTEEALQLRLVEARREVECVTDYDYVVVNDNLDECIDQLRCIILAERQSQRVVGPRLRAIAETFREPA
jgi:guanylate kinase